MLYDLKSLIGSPVHATDGETGNVRDFLFDDQSWTVRYLVVDVGNWLRRRDVVLPVTALEPPNWAAKTCRVRLTKEQVRESPDVDAERPIWRQQELAMRDYFGALACWADAEYGFASIPAGVQYPVPEGENPNLRSVHRMTGYDVRAIDGDFGHLDGFIMDEDGWHLGYLEVNAQGWLHHRTVVVPTAWVDHVSWAEFRVYLHRTRAGT
ncbi:MAG: PRC-barrel domain-containing protein [Terracidiphilus sp.]